MPDQTKCSQCGASRAADLPGDLCLGCLLTLGLKELAPISAEADGAHSEETADQDFQAETFGRYRIMEKLGEGGCGIVYRAEQSEPVRREVALKVIKLGMDTRNVIARFEAERQALAMMDHPGIARVFDAGATESGRPYFAMELVRGERITDFCQRRQMDIAGRLNLFVEVCQAVQHAHQKGVIHRDLKPSNILVLETDGRAVPKVIDFGVAKATARQRLGDETVYTAFDQFVGTPAYMSPEQAGLAGDDVDTRSDVYSLGVLLYELLTGHPPFDPNRLRRSALNEVCRIICEEEPIKPSKTLDRAGTVRATQEAGPEQTTLNSQIKSLSSDLDWIVMKAIEKDRARRYESASSLASDIGRYLNHEPVSARPPSAAYRIGKMIRRNRLAFVMGAVIVILLIASTIISTRRYLREQQARQAAVKAGRDARVQLARSEQVTRFLKEMLQSAGPSVARGRDTALMREVLDRAATRVREELRDQPETEADLCATIGDAYAEVGEMNQAEAMDREALRLREQLYGPGSEPVAESLGSIARVLNQRGQTGDYVEAESLARRALVLRRKLHPPDDRRVAKALEYLAWSLRVQKTPAKAAEAETLLREALAIRTKLSGADSVEASYPMESLALICLQDHSRLGEGEALMRKVLAIQRKGLGDDDPNLPESAHVLAMTLWSQGRSKDAEPVVREAVRYAKKLFGPDNERIVGILSLESCVLSDVGKYAEAESAIREAVELDEKHEGPEHPFLADYLWPTLTWALYGQKKYSEAEEVARKSVALARKLNRGEVLRHSLFWLTLVLTAQDRWEEAEPLMREQLSLCDTLYPDGKGNNVGRCFQTRRMLGEALFRRGQYPEAEAMFLAAYAGLKDRHEGWAVIQCHRCVEQLAQVYEATGQPGKAAEWKRRALPSSESPPAN